MLDPQRMPPIGWKARFSPSYFRGEAECRRKVRHPTRESAEEASRSTLGQRQERMHSYLCKHCKGWHNGHPRGDVLSAYEPHCRCGHLAGIHALAAEDVGCRVCSCGAPLEFVYKRALRIYHCERRAALRMKRMLSRCVAGLLWFYPQVMRQYVMSKILGADANDGSSHRANDEGKQRTLKSIILVRDRREPELYPFAQDSVDLKALLGGPIKVMPLRLPGQMPLVVLANSDAIPQGARANAQIGNILVFGDFAIAKATRGFAPFSIAEANELLRFIGRATDENQAKG